MATVHTCDHCHRVVGEAHADTAYVATLTVEPGSTPRLQVDLCGRCLRKLRERMKPQPEDVVA